MKKIGKISSWTLSGFLFLLVAFSFFSHTLVSYAQTNGKATKEFVDSKKIEEQTSNNARSFQTSFVNVYDAKLAKQEGRKLEFSFQIENDENVQPGISYGVQLIRMNRLMGGSVAGVFMSPEKLVIGSGKTLEKTFSVTVPDAFAADEYTARIVVSAPTGMLLAFGEVPSVRVPDVSSERVEVRNCLLHVGTEPGDKLYSLGQGVDIKSDEALHFVCEVANKTDHDIKVSPRFETYRRTVLSGTIINTKALNPQEYTVGGGHTSRLIFQVPAVDIPQAYDVVMHLADGSGKIVSDDTIAHYVLRGESATIQNVFFDKSDGYAVGDEAQVSYSWDGPADNFPQSRIGGLTDAGVLYAELHLMDEKGASCADVVKQNLSQGSDVLRKVSFKVTAGCVHPKLSLKLANSGGKILDAVEVSTKPVEKNGKHDVSRDGSSNDELPFYRKGLWIVVGIGCILLVILIIALLRRGSRSRIVTHVLILGFSLASGLVFVDSPVQAATFSITGPGGTVFGNHDWTTNFTVGLDRYSYPKNGAIKASGAASWSSCTNGHVFGGGSTINAVSIDDGRSPHTSADVSGTYDCPNGLLSCGYYYKSGTLSASGAVGADKRVRFDAKDPFGNTSSLSLKYTVNASPPPISPPARCGSAARTYSADETGYTGNFCNFDSVSPLYNLGDGPPWCSGYVNEYGDYVQDCSYPNFPAQGGTQSWNCSVYTFSPSCTWPADAGYDMKDACYYVSSSTSCSANRENPPAPVELVPSCGPAAFQSSMNAPTANLCKDGNTSAPVLSSDGLSWTWTCTSTPSGINTAQCSAPKTGGIIVQQKTLEVCQDGCNSGIEPAKISGGITMSSGSTNNYRACYSSFAGCQSNAPGADDVTNSAVWTTKSGTSSTLDFQGSTPKGVHAKPFPGGGTRADGVVVNYTPSGGSLNTVSFDVNVACPANDSCKASICSSQTCTDSCGNVYNGTKSCSGKIGPWLEVSP